MQGIPELGRKFRQYFGPMDNRILHVYYDRSGNAYKKIVKDNISDLEGSHRAG